MSEAQQTGETISEIASLKKRRDFLYLRSGKRYSGRYFTIQAGPNTIEGSPLRVGFTVTTKTGNAVARNRIKRRLRQVASSVLPTKGLRGFDYVVIARRAVLHAKFDDLTDQFATALDHLHRTEQPANGKAAGAKRKKDTGNP